MGTEVGGGEREKESSSLEAECKMWLNSTFLSYTRSSFMMAVSFLLSGERTGFAVKQSNVRMTSCVMWDKFLYLADV